MTDAPSDERKIPVTTGLLALLLGGVATLLLMLFSVQDRFVSADMLDARLKLLSAEIDIKLERFRTDVAADLRAQIETVRQQMAKEPQSAPK
jgi:hypothetical protein